MVESGREPFAAPSFCISHSLTEFDATILGRVSFAIRKTEENEKFSTGIMSKTMPRARKGVCGKM